MNLLAGDDPEADAYNTITASTTASPDRPRAWMPHTDNNSPWQSIDQLAPGMREAIEQRTLEIGRYLFEHLDTPSAMPLQRRWWDDQLMNWAMSDESLKVQLFRFVDCLPMLQTNEAVVSHLQEYLSEARATLTGPIRALLGVGRRTSLTRAAIARLARVSAMDLARKFIAGTSSKEVLDAVARSRKLKRAFTLDLLGEAVISEAEAREHFDQYVKLLEEVAPEVNQWEEIPQIDRAGEEPLPRMNLSIKLSGLTSQFDPIAPESVMNTAGERFRELLRVARRQRAFINVDMESYEKKDLTLHLFRTILMEEEFRDTCDVGIVLQCYLRDTPRDLERLRDWAAERGTPVWVRLVKGAYWEYETIHAGEKRWPIPVYQQKWQSDACFEAATRFMLQNSDSLRLALGTHNLRSIAHGLAAAGELGVAKHDIELQMLFGMADAEKQALTDLGYRLRIYMPYGELIPGMAYLVRRLLENTSNDSFLRASFVEHASPDELIRSPEASRPETTEEEETMTTAYPPTPLASRFPNHPPVDFTKEENRVAMQATIDAVGSGLGKHHPLVINNAEITADEVIESRNPSRWEQVVGTVASAGEEHADRAVAAASKAFAEWSCKSAAERAGYIRNVAQQMRDRLFELSALMSYESGKPWREATADVCEAIDFCEYYAAGAEAMEDPSGGDAPGEENRFVYRPRGVAAVVAPWNFPLAILTGMTTAALATGNTVIMKPAEQSPVIAAELMRMFLQAGVPPGVVNYLPGYGATVGAALVVHPGVALIAFTGSRQVGLGIHRKAAEVSHARLSQHSLHDGGSPLVKHVIAEMGGKNGIIVDADADLDEAVQGVVDSAFGYAGQKCSACSRTIVVADIHDQFVARLVEATRSLRVGPATDPATDVPPVIDRESVERLKSYIEIGRSEATLALEGELPEGLAEQGNFVAPHIFTDCPPDARIAQEEIFGPLLAVVKTADFETALRIANGTEYALTGGIFSRSPAHLDRARQAFDVGNLYLNRAITGALVGRQPFGGYRLSGIGTKAGGPDYLLQFVVPRTITENTLRRGFAPESES